MNLKGDRILRCQKDAGSIAIGGQRSSIGSGIAEMANSFACKLKLNRELDKGLK